VTSHAASVEPHPFRDFEHRGWQDSAARYPASFAGATTPYAELLLDAVGAGPGTRLLDIACGPGIVAAAALRRGCSVVGVDFSSAMVSEARRLLPGATFHEADAEALPLPDGGFDAAVCNFGLHHFPYPQRALRETVRMLRPGGRLAATVWAPPELNRGWQILLDAVAAHGDPAITAPTSPHGRLNRPEDCQRLLAEAGCAHAIAAPVHAVWRLAAPADLYDGFLAGTVRMATLLGAQSDAARTQIRAAVAAAVATLPRMPGEAGCSVPTAAILISAPATPPRDPD
jgi:SAM-dependent methyltransferase